MTLFKITLSQQWDFGMESPGKPKYIGIVSSNSCFVHVYISTNIYENLHY